jgi:hypothetical protein
MRVAEAPSLNDIREHARQEHAALPERVRALTDPATVRAALSPAVEALRDELTNA